MRPRSVRARTTLAATTVVALALVAAGAVVVMSLWTNLRGQADDDAERTARGVAESLSRTTTDHNLRTPMPRRLISSGSTFEKSIGYSRAVVDGDWVFVSGTTGFDYSTMTIQDDVVAQCEQALRSSGQRLVALAELKQRDPQLYEAKLTELQHEVQISKLTAEYRRAVASKDTDRAQAIMQQLRAVLQVQLLMSIKTRGDYICRLEEQIQRAKDELAHDAARFGQMVDERLDELTQAGTTRTATTTATPHCS